MATQFDAYQQILRQQRLQTGLMVGQIALAGHMSTSLNQISGEMAAIRQLNLQGLAIQQEMLQRDQLQSQMEEFIYNSQKMVTAFSEIDCEQPPSVRYFSLKGITDTVRQLGIGTALIRGRDNKAAFEAAMQDVDRLITLLKGDPEVIEAIAWAKAEQKRIDDEQQRRRQERQRLLARNDLRRTELHQRISDLKASRRKVMFTDWYNNKFDAYLHRKSPYDKLPLISELSKDMYAAVAPALLWLCGWPFIGLWYLLEKPFTENKINAEINNSIAELEREVTLLSS